MKKCWDRDVSKRPTAKLENNSDHTNQLLTLIWFSFVRKDDQCVMLGLQTVWRLGAY
jgi:hypothetical protein